MRVITVAGFNTSIDRRIRLSTSLSPGAVQRAHSGQAVPGGKGIHVAQMVAELGEEVRLVGLTDQLHGPWIDSYLRARQVEWHGVMAPSQIRQCIALHDPAGQTTEVLEPGVELGHAVQGALLMTLKRVLADADVLVLSGSLPIGFPADTYNSIVRSATERGVCCIVDTSGEALRLAIEAKPWVVKPNADEASALMGRSVRNVAAAAACVRELQRRGVEHPVVTLGAGGAVAGDDDTVWHAWSDPIKVQNSVGSGDCLVAALAIAALRNGPFEATLKCGIACGSANATTDEAGFASTDQVQVRAARVHVRRV